MNHSFKIHVKVENYLQLYCHNYRIVMETLLFTLELPSWRHCGFCLLVSGVTQQQDKNMQECASACRSKPQANCTSAGEPRRGPPGRPHTDQPLCFSSALHSSFSNSSVSFHAAPPLTLSSTIVSAQWGEIPPTQSLIQLVLEIFTKVKGSE